MLLRKALPPLLLSLATAVAACSERKPPDGTATPLSPGDTAFAVCAPDAGGGMCSCEEPSEDARKAPGFDPALRRFLADLGGACKAKDYAFLAKSVRFPLRWRAVVGVKVPGGPPITEPRRIASPEQLCERNVFEDIQGVDPANPAEPDAGALGLAEHGAQCRVDTLVGQFDATLVLERSGPGWTLVAVEAGD
ncbi:MAG: hypothetical protein M0R80_19505 [Proteobacteria bacterium]|jgi:hypothetical protein|nr:hypothetical protein [Pseudomonadota bacterium]